MPTSKSDATPSGAARPRVDEPRLNRRHPPSADATGKPPQNPGDGEAPDADSPDLALPHERDAASGHVADAPDPTIARAKKDLDQGQVDTDLWGTAGLDHARRERLVPDVKGDRTDAADPTKGG